MSKRPSVPPLSPSAASTGSGKAAHKKNASQTPLSIQEENDDVIFSRDAQELLRRTSFAETLERASHKGWLRKLASNGRRWNKRFVVIHGHYLSYFKADVIEDKKNLMGAVNLWRVESVTLDKNVIVVALAPDVTVNNNSFLDTFGLKTKAMTNKILLEAKDATEANKWITTMKVTPFEQPSPRGRDTSRDTDFTDVDDLDDGRSQASAKTVVEDIFKVKSVHVSISDDRFYDFLDISDLTDTTRLRIGELDPSTRQAMVAVEIESPAMKETHKSTAKFAPYGSSNGVLKLSYPGGGEVHIAWEVDDEATVDELIRLAMAEDGPTQFILPLAGGMFGVTLFIIYFVLEFRFLTSAFVASIVSGSAVAMLSVPSASSLSSAKSDPRYVFTTITYISTRRLTSGTVSSATMVIEQASAKKKESKLGGDDVSILKDEKPRLVDFKKRLAGVRTAEFVESAMKDGKWDRIQTEWKVEEATRMLSEIQERIVTKYIDNDFRLVRFLRARSQNLDRAEKLLRASLLWRMAVRPDFFIDDYNPPRWIIEYGGAPLFVNSISDRDKGTESRLKNWWLFDKEGGCAMFFRAGCFDWRRINKKMGNAISLMKVGFWAMELGRKDQDILHERTNGATPSYFTAVIDLEGFSLTQQIPLTELIPLARRFFSTLATSYPELIKRVIVVNTPFLFNGLWQAIRPFIPEEVQSKIQIHGRCDAAKHLFPYFDVDQVPAYLGGKLVGDNGDIYCKNRLPPVGPYLPDAGAELLKLK